MMFRESNATIKITAFIIAFITIIVYLPSLQNGFVNWDDNKYIYENSFMSSIDFKSIKWMFTTFHMSAWHPLTWFSHFVDYSLWGLNPMGHHLTNIIFHGLNTFLVVIIITRLIVYVKDKCQTTLFNEKLKQPYNPIIITAALTGLLFGLHPLHVESVAWISERKDVLYAFFYLLSIIYYLKYASSVSKSPSESPHIEINKISEQAASKEKSRNYVLCLLFFILALMSKNMAVTLPLILIVIDFYPLERLGFRSVFTGQRKILIEKLPFFALSLVTALIALIANQKGPVLHYSIILSDRVLVAFRALCFYLYKMLWPTGLVPVYPYPSQVSVFKLEYTGAIILVLGITALCIFSWKKKRIFPAVWAYYIIILLPTLGIIQVGIQEAAADRYAYLSSLGPFLLVSLGITSVYVSVSKKNRLYQAKIFLFTVLTLVTCLLSFLTIRQTEIWENSTILWNAQINKFPDTEIAYKNLAEAHAKNGRYNESIESLNKALELTPDDPSMYYNRGIGYGKTGQHYKAIKDFKRAIKLIPQEAKYRDELVLAEYYSELGVANGSLGNYKQAVENLNEAIKLDPQFTRAFFYRGVAYKNLNIDQYATRDFQTAARLGYKNAQDYLKTQGITW